MKKRIVSLFLCMLLVLSMGTTAFAASQFSDVSKQDYFYEPVKWALENEITSGTSATTFSPYATCTRGQVATFLWRLNGKPEPTTTNNPFVDVKESDYFYKAVLWAVEEGITAGTSATTFSPSNNCTYAQVITFLWRAEEEPFVENAAISNLYGDVYYKNAVAWAATNDVLSGSANQFAPNDDCPRADIVTYMYYASQEKDSSPDTSSQTGKLVESVRISLNGELVENFALNVGESVQLTLDTTPSDAVPQSITWSVGTLNGVYASISDDGVLTGVAPGFTSIMVECDGVYSSAFVNVVDTSPVTIKNLKQKTDFVGGTEWTFDLTNNSGKTIKYVTITWNCYNAVGDVLYDYIAYVKDFSVKITGPLSAGQTLSNITTTRKFYNYDFNTSGSVVINSIVVEYMDGESVTVDPSCYTGFWDVIGN